MTTARTKVLAGTLLSTLITLGVAPAVYARSVGAWSGNPVGITVSRGTCFSESAGAVLGKIATGCNGTWEVNLPIDASGSYSVSFTAANNTGALGSVSCMAYAVSPNGTFTNSSSVSASSTTLTSYSLTSVSVPSGGNLYIACFGMANGEVGTIAW